MPKQPSAAFILIDKVEFWLDLYKLRGHEYKRQARYDIALGAAGHGTKPGIFVISAKDRTPEYTVPDSDWVRDETDWTPGDVIAHDDPANPVAPRWMTVGDPKNGIGIHGTANLASLGTRASHGCIRMAPDDVIALFEATPTFATVEIRGKRG